MQHSQTVMQKHVMIELFQQQVHYWKQKQDAQQRVSSNNSNVSVRTDKQTQRGNPGIQNRPRHQRLTRAMDTNR
eukprot:3668662-Ditylum_brightwellii.AAC.1